jgi:type II secretory ATPase GspE/PulE/Tfp pilus assembly ATPase PilB-like protein
VKKLTDKINPNPSPQTEAVQEHSESCQKCSGTGFAGQALVLEIFHPVFNEGLGIDLTKVQHIKKLIAEGANSVEIEKYAILNDIYTPMCVALLNKVLAGEIATKEAEKYLPQN